MLVSVIIAVRNEERYLSVCLDSVLAQIHAPLEILTIDGMSTDRSPAILADYARRDDRIRVFANPGLRAGCAFNVGIRQARGEVIVILGAHTRVASDFVAANLRVLKETGADIAGGVIETRRVGYMGTAIALVLSSRFGTGTSFRCARKAGEVDTVAFGAYRAGVFRELGSFLETTPGDDGIEFNAEELEFNHRAVRAGKRICMDPGIRPVYFCRTNLATLLRKNFKTGRVVMAMFLARPGSVSTRHMVPSLFCLTLLLSALLSPSGTRFSGSCSRRHRPTSSAASGSPWSSLSAADCSTSPASFWRFLCITCRMGWPASISCLFGPDTFCPERSGMPARLDRLRRRPLRRLTQVPLDGFLDAPFEGHLGLPAQPRANPLDVEHPAPDVVDVAPVDLTDIRLLAQGVLDHLGQRADRGLHSGAHVEDHPFRLGRDQRGQRGIDGIRDKCEIPGLLAVTVNLTSRPSSTAKMNLATTPQ